MKSSEIDGCKEGEIVVNPIYQFTETETDTFGNVSGSWVRAGELYYKEKLFMAGMKDNQRLPDTLI